MKHLLTRCSKYTSLLLFLITAVLSCDEVDNEIDRQNKESGIIVFEPTNALLGDTASVYIKNGLHDVDASLKIGNAAVEILEKTDGHYNGNPAEIWKIIIPRNAPFGEPPAELTVKGERKPAFYGLVLSEPPALIEGKVTASLFAGTYREREFNECGYQIIYPEENGPALEAQFGQTGLIASSRTGNVLYVVERYEPYTCDGTDVQLKVLIRKIQDGVVSTLAGGGDDPEGDGLSAKLPLLIKGMAVNDEGLVYLALTELDYDMGTSKSRIISMHPVTGEINTVAGGAIDTGDYYGKIKDGTALEAKLFEPGDMAFDRDGNLFFLDKSNTCIRKLSANGTVTTLFGPVVEVDINGETYLDTDYSKFGHEDGFGNQEASFGQMTGIAPAGNGKLYVVDNGGGKFGACVREINPTTQEVATIIGLPNGVKGKETGSFKEVSGRPAGTEGYFGMDTDFDGNLLLTLLDGGGALSVKLLKVDLQFETVKLIAGGGSVLDPTKPVPGDKASLYGDNIVFDDKGNLYIGDNINFIIRKIEREK